VRTPVEHVASSGRNTQGVTLIRLSKDEKLVAMARVEHEESDDELVDAMREDGTFAVEGQEQIDIDAETGNSATTDINDVIDGANDDLVDNETSNDAADENTDDDE
jgi:DNA gyrase subunit A